MDETTLIILLGGLGFALLAFVLLTPVFLFLKKEERLSREWTDEALAERHREVPPSATGSTVVKEEWMREGEDERTKRRKDAGG